MYFSIVKKVVVVVLASCALLTGCFEIEEKKPVQTVDWYKAHDVERQAMIKECGNNPGELGETPNCKNAMAAAVQLSSGKLRRIDNW